MLPAVLVLALAGCDSQGGGSSDAAPLPDVAPLPDGGLPDATPPGDPCQGVTPVTGVPLTTEVIASNLAAPVDIAAPAGELRRLFIVEQVGQIRVVEDGVLLPTPFLTLAVSSGSERGLLGLAFHPEYWRNGRFFVNYTDPGGDTVVSELLVSADPNRADPGTERVIITIPQFQSNHNGGGVAVGPEGYLWIGMGDGGGANDPREHGQDPTTLLGAMLRLDIDGPTPYAIPPDNPFVGGGGEPEIFSIGVRNPWRFSFDRETGDLYIGDVGQDDEEEIDVALFADGLGNGANYGWDDCEGFIDFEGSCAGHVPPALTFPHPEGCSVTGGYVYRGCRMPDLHGTYFYSDYCAGFIRTFRFVGGAVTDERDLTAELGFQGALFEVSTFGLDAQGELYIARYSSGQVVRVIPGP